MFPMLGVGQAGRCGASSEPRRGSSGRPGWAGYIKDAHSYEWA